MQWGEAGELRLQASDWSVQLGGRTLIQHVDLAVPATGSLAVLGESASDKSSLLRLLSGAMAGHPQLVGGVVDALGGSALAVDAHHVACVCLEQGFEVG